MTQHEIVFIHELDHVPTQEDRANCVGIEGFIEKLKRAEWVDHTGDKVLVPFHYSCGGVSTGGLNYIEYKATHTFENG